MPIFQLKNNVLNIKVNSVGAELCSVVSNDTNIEYIWQANKNVWARHAPVLFPIVGKLKNGKYSINSKTYELPQHGFARDSEFICIEQNECNLVFELVASEYTLTLFPFHFSLQIKYKLIHNNIEVSYSVFNPDSNDLYFSIGAHPAFNCPLQANESFNDYQLHFEKNKLFKINELNQGLITSQQNNLQLNNNKLQVSKQLFDNDALVFINSQINEVTLVSELSNHGVKLISKNWPYFGIWSKKNQEQFVCLEPWYGIADFDSSQGDFKNKLGIIKIESEHYFNCLFNMLFF